MIYRVTFHVIEVSHLHRSRYRSKGKILQSSLQTQVSSERNEEHELMETTGGVGENDMISIQDDNNTGKGRSMRLG